MSTIDAYWSFRSPYSYLVTPDLLSLRKDYNVTVKLRPVLPIALRDKAVVFNREDRSKLNYIILDALRRAEFLGMKIAIPEPDPVVMSLETLEIAEEQPYIHDLMALGFAAEQSGKGIDLAHAVSHLIWGGTKNWDAGDKLRDTLAAIGLNLSELRAQADKLDYSKELEQSHASLKAAGHWGVPTMVFSGEPFFGQDRIDTLRWRLDKAGLKRS